VISSNVRVMAKRGRPQINHEQTPARFPEGTLERIDSALDEGENRSDLIREAVERELKRRERRAR
jgi:metal-responsive CopG/Arc/MetJ family transcriptional regulator